MAAYRRVYDSRHLQADCQEPGSAPEPYARQSSMGYFFHGRERSIVCAKVAKTYGLPLLGFGDAVRVRCGGRCLMGCLLFCGGRGEAGACYVLPGLSVMIEGTRRFTLRRINRAAATVCGVGMSYRRATTTPTSDPLRVALTDWLTRAVLRNLRHRHLSVGY